MASAVQALRDAIEAWQQAHAADFVARWRGDAEAELNTRPSKVLSWLCSQQALEALEEARSERQLSPAQERALTQWLGLARMQGHAAELTRAHNDVLVVGGRQLTRSQAWDELVATDDPRRRVVVADVLEQHAATHWNQQIETRAQLAERGEVDLPSPIDAALQPQVLTGAERFLSQTRELALEQTRYLTRLDEPYWHDVLRALRAPAMDGLLRRDGRLRRAAQRWHVLGFERELSSRVRVESASHVGSPWAPCVVSRAPTDVRVCVPATEWGLLSELCVTASVARALSMALVSSALPVELRRDPGAEVPHTMGWLAAMLLSDRQLLRRDWNIAPREAETLARIAGVALLLVARRLAALLVIDHHGISDREHAQHWARQAWACEVDAPLFVGSVGQPTALMKQVEAALLACVLPRVLRERFNEDWARNPRVSDVLRGAAMRGGELSNAAWGNELGVDLADASALWIERLG